MNPIEAIRALRAFNALEKVIPDMPSLLKILSSRTVWMFLGLAMVNGLQEISPQLPQKYQVAVNAVLTLAGIFFRVTPKQDFHPELEGKLN